MPHEYQAFFPAALCLCSPSSDFQSLSETGGNVVIDILWPITDQNTGSDLTIWLSHQWHWDDSPLPYRYVSELLTDPSRAAEFLVTEKKFRDFALLCAKIAFGVMP